MQSIRAIQQLNKRELEAGINPEGSWHTDYRDTAFIYIGGLPFELSEGDIITIFSQYGEPVWVKLARDRETGKSRGFAWIKYEDQRSCDLAVDNLSGASIMDRLVRVDHARYKPKDDEDMRDNTMGEPELIDKGNESDGGRRKRRKTESDSDSDEDRPLLPEEIELGKLIEKLAEDDPMRDSMIKRQQERVDDALRKMKKQKQKEKERAKRKDRHSRRDKSRDRDRDRHRDKDRKRIKGEEDDDEREKRSRPREHRSKSRDRSANEDRRHRKPRLRDSSEDRDRCHRSVGSRDRSEDPRDRRDRHRRRERRRSGSGEDIKPSRVKDSRSPLPYRARSP
ncbi:U2 snRNP component IST3 [Pyrenophora seminiperda CCB06]|uniref:U2 snRNP component IST3 n=1 Tax=Pyrenophora seminiperda CCB06 TaxID=1302712 RepID=A0A3M7M4Y2_9PLEO|nr:U2 snRNP component IST3 [Pyrenophora seminiperda CCB06]